MKDNHLFDRVCKECTKFEDKVSGGWWTYPVAKSLSGVYIDIMGDDGDATIVFISHLFVKLECS